jgi:large subunit ribosomal protein L22
MNESRATLKYLRIAPRKVRIVCDLVRNKNAAEALNLLRFAVKRGAEPVYKLVDSAISNATTNHSMDADELFVKEIYVGEGPTLRRFKQRAMGRATRVNKRTSHITVVLGIREDR